MDIQNLLYSKNGLSTKTLAKRMLCFEEGERIPTVTELNNEIHLARGTVQNAIKLLQKSGAVTLEAHGQSGTILKKKDVRKLLEIAGISHILGVMPLPYSKRYEGLATGLVADLETGTTFRFRWRLCAVRKTGCRWCCATGMISQSFPGTRRSK